jgi:hypothetical protein
LLKDYAQTPFAKTILDPEYGKRLSDEDNGFSSLYNKVYDLYASKQYAQVVSAADALLQQYPGNRYAAQLAYLRAFAAGHQEKLTPFQSELQLIVTKYPNDQLVTPLVNQHLAYINVNQAELSARPVVLTEKSDIEFTIPIVYQQKTEYRPASVGFYQPAPDIRSPEKKPLEAPVQAAKPVVTQSVSVIANQPQVPPQQVPVLTEQPQVVTQPAAKPVVTPPLKTTPFIFSNRDSSNYYFVVNVNSGTTNVASSRFGIGQFNRVNFEREAIRHRLKNAGPDNQLIAVGRFYSLNNVKDYARRVIPLLPDIMKVPKDKYSFFIITKENLDKLADKKILDSYMDYYQNNF